MTREAYILAGPTASGKSALAAVLAREMGAYILSADSMNVYKGMDVGTAKPSAAEREEFHMGGVDVVTPDKEFSSGAWLRAAAKWARGVPKDKPIIIVGGTGLYFSALLRGLDRKWEKPAPEYPVIKIDRSVVRARIARRLDDMFMAGLEEEKCKLHAEYPVWSKTAALAIGYREGDSREKILTRTCQLAKRQDTWFRHQATPIYVEPTVEAVRECWAKHGPWQVKFSGYEGAIFDQDGLLFDTESIYQAAWLEAGARQGVAIDPKIPRSFSGMGRARIGEIVKGAYPQIDIELYLKTGVEIAWGRQLSGKPEPKKGLFEILEFCRSNGIKTSVASSAPRHVVERNLKAAGVFDYFDAITTGDEVKNSKPAPDIFLLAAERIGVEPRACCVFEDAFSGIRGAVAAGMGAVLIPDQSEPTEEILAICRSFSDLSAAKVVL